MPDLRTDDLWERITSLSKKAKRRYVAVAWLARGASKLLTLGQNDILVVDMSDASVKTGRTDPKEILAYLGLGVRVYSVSNLHAKVFVLGERVLIGSSNVSTHSRDTLLEAAIETSDAGLRTKAKKWIESLAQAPITPAIANAKSKLYNPPKWGTPAGLSGKKARVGTKTTKIAATEGRLWIVATEDLQDWPEDEAPILSKQVADAKRKLKDKANYWVDTIRYTGSSKFCSQVARGDSVITIHDDGDSIEVYSAAPVISARRYRVGNKHRTGVHLQRRNDPATYTLNSIKNFGKALGLRVTTTMSREISSPAMKDALLRELEQ